MRHLLHAVLSRLRGYRPTLGVRIIVRDGEGRVLLVRHTYTHGWHLPGGGVNRSESLEAAARRELGEECGIAADELSLLGILFNDHGRRSDHVALYVATSWRTVGPADLGGEIAELRSIDPAAPPPETSPGTRRRLAELVAGVPPAERW